MGGVNIMEIYKFHAKSKLSLVKGLYKYCPTTLQLHNVVNSTQSPLREGTSSSFDNSLNVNSKQKQFQV